MRPKAPLGDRVPLRGLAGTGWGQGTGHLHGASVRGQGTRLGHDAELAPALAWGQGADSPRNAWAPRAGPWRPYVVAVWEKPSDAHRPLGRPCAAL